VRFHDGCAVAPPIRAALGVRAIIRPIHDADRIFTALLRFTNQPLPPRVSFALDLPNPDEIYAWRLDEIWESRLA
jgi:hypothetical protein